MVKTAAKQATIAEALDRAMLKSGMTEVQVAAACGVSQSAITRWRKGPKEPLGKHAISLLQEVPGFAEEFGLRVSR
jgi:transcriptional regulator with XRE-family HTH domain